MGVIKRLIALTDPFQDPEYAADIYRMRNNEQTTIAAILEMEPGTKDDPQWVNGEFSAVVSEWTARKTKSGTDFVSGTLDDPDTNATINFSWFGRRNFPAPGSTVLVGGNGISLTEYNGDLQLTFGKGTTVNTVGHAPDRQERTQTRSAAPARSTPPPARQNASSAPAGAFLGVTVGMALNNACQFTLEEAKDPGASGLRIGDPEFYRRIWDHASQILRVAQVLEKGKLAPNPTDTNEAEPEPEPEPQPERTPPRRAERPQPGPGGSVRTDDIDPEDVPF